MDALVSVRERMAKTMKFKKGDWCFCEYKLQQIKEMKDGQISEVSDGMFSTGSRSLNDRCFPVDLKIKRISDEFQHYSDMLHAEKSFNLNYPDIHRYLVAQWAAACEAIADYKKVEAIMEEVEQFRRGISDILSDIRYKNIQGVLIFRR